MMNTRSKSSLQKGKGSKLKNKRGPDKHTFVSKCSKTVNRTLNRSSSTTRKEKKKKSDVPCSRKITEYFFESPKTQASNNNNNLDLIGFRKGTLSPICVTSDSKVDHNDIENRSRTRYEFNNATDCSWETMYFDGKPCKSEKSRDDKFTHSVNVSGEANALTNNMEIEKPTVCDIPSYQQIIKDKKDCDTYIREVQNLVSLLPDTPEKSPASHHYNTRSRSKSSSNEERTPKTKQKLESKVDSPNKMSAAKSKRKLNFEKLKKENCDQLSNISNKKSLPERSQDSYNSTRSRSKSSSSERHQHHGYQTRSKSVSSNSQSPKAAKHEILVRDKKANSKARKSRERQKKSPKQKISKFFERTPKTKQKLESKVDSPNKMSAGKSKRKLDFEKLEKENCDRPPVTSNKKNLESKKSSTTFRRYGVYVPSYEDILSEKKHYDDYSNLVDSLTKLVVPLPEIKINDYDSPPVQIKVLNCKHMSKEALFRAYENNIQYMEDIISEKIMSERHEKYKRVATREELTYNTSMITFTNEQKQLLVTDLCEKFGQTSAHSDYYFKVLLPELCLKIFMDEHAMSREEATEYLDCYPV